MADNQSEQLADFGWNMQTLQFVEVSRDVSASQK
jgi:hypothetical protein